MLKRAPLPITGVMLGRVTLGSLLRSYGEGFHVAFGTIAVLLGLPFVAKLIGDLESIQNDMKNPMLASISGTFSMALLLFTASVTAPTFGVEAIGSACFWFGLVSFVILTVVIVKRYTKAGESPVPARLGLHRLC